ncbi:ParB/RepB/Spo0J family partition protein [Phenylobacterium immobile]|uniref:ParB/RepB/Spo0J family partition protein n=1 Tax=Phenylobacterium immobile TaxID=21 RepID=UPI000B122B9C|nr:ParB/RepB/Spo0J family partition protein [Phenylobacterium immobile]
MARGLGRGLSALLNEEEGQTTGAATPPASGAREIPIELIEANPDQPRRHFAETELAELAQSIRESGVLQPILLRPSPSKPGMFEIVAGERRWRATQAAGHHAIPALVRELTDERAFEVAIIENIQREDLNAMEEAQAYQSLIGRAGYTQDKAGQVLGKSRSHVANTLRLLQLPAAVQDHVLYGRLSAGHARAILTADDQERLADQIVAKGLSVRDAEALVRARAAGPKKTSGPRKANKDADTAALEADLEDALGMGVDIVDRGGAGALTIRYDSLEQLDELCRRLTRR